jgi:hypothetical protein
MQLYASYNNKLKEKIVLNAILITPTRISPKQQEKGDTEVK